MDEWEKFLDEEMDDSFFDQAPRQSDEDRTEWSREENRQFEHALIEFDDHSSPTLFENLASRVPSKTIADVITHFHALQEDVDMIEADLIELPKYKDDQCDLNVEENGHGSSSNQQIATGTRYKKRGIPWTDEEHRLFLEGLQRFGKGDWRSISRFCVKTRTPTQVASHAQKYFLRLQQNSNPDKKRRHSINDTQHVSSSSTITVSVPQTDQNEPLPRPTSFNNMTFPSSVTTTTTNSATISIPLFNPEMSTTMQSSSSASASTLDNWFWSD